MATIYLYGAFVEALGNKEIDLTADDIRVALVTSTHTPNQDTHEYWDDVVANEASGTGYTANGDSLATKTFTYSAATNTWTFDADDVEWANSSVTARYAVIYDRTPATDATRPLIGYIDFGADRTSSEGLFRIAWHANGIFTATV